MPMARRGEIWLADLGMVQKTRLLAGLNKPNRPNFSHRQIREQHDGASEYHGLAGARPSRKSREPKQSRSAHSAMQIERFRLKGQPVPADIQEERAIMPGNGT
jgi:hypothetical protein